MNDWQWYDYHIVFAVIIRAIAPCHIGEDAADE